jgi:hypothetical protein
VSALDSGLAAIQAQPPAAEPASSRGLGYALDLGDLGLQASPTDQAVVAGELVQISVDRLARDVPIRSDAFPAHGVEGILKKPELDLREQAWVDFLGAPDAADRRLLVDKNQGGIGLEFEICLGRNEAIPAFVVDMDGVLISVGPSSSALISAWALTGSYNDNIDSFCCHSILVSATFVAS